MTRDDVDRFLKRRQLAWNDRDSHALVADHADDAVAESPTHGTITGRDTIRGVYETWLDAFPDVHFQIDDSLVEGDRVTVFFTSTGTHMRAFASIPATGRHMAIHGVLLMTFRDGRIVHEKRLYDSTAASADWCVESEADVVGFRPMADVTAFKRIARRGPTRILAGAAWSARHDPQRSVRPRVGT